MKAWLIIRTFFVVVGILTTALVVFLVALYFYFRQVGILPFLGGTIGSRTGGEESGGTPVPTYDHPLLTPAQEQAAAQAGIDTRALPTQITPTQEACAVAVVGQARVNEIKSGAAPSLIEILRIKPCFE